MDKLEILFNLNNMIFDYSNGLLKILRFPFEIKTKGIRKKNLDLVKFKTCERCFVVGLGPSLRGVDFSKLDGDIIATNRFNKFDEHGQFKPTFYCLFDGAFFNGNAEDDLVAACKNYPDTCFVLNGKYKSRIENNVQISKNLNLYYAYMWDGAFKRSKQIDFAKIIPVSNNVVNIGIYLGLYCGYKEIILLGCDFNSFASTTANHCYNDTSKERLWAMDYELYCYSLVAHSHMELMKYAKLHNVKIINATRGSLLDAYPFDDELMSKIYYKESNEKVIK